MLEIQERSVTNVTFKDYSWKNSDLTKWSAPDGGWEIAKVFMNQGQTQSEHNAQDTDFSGILNFINNCKFARDYLQDETLAGQVSV